MQIIDRINQVFETGYGSIERVSFWVLLEKGGEVYLREFIREFKSEFPSSLCIISAPDVVLEEVPDLINWRELTRLKKHELSMQPEKLEKFIDKFQDRVFWPVLIDHPFPLSEKLILKYKTKLPLHTILMTRQLSEGTLRSISDVFDDECWKDVSIYQRSLSEGFLRDYIGFIELDTISWAQQLSEEFMDDYKDALNWANLCICQRMSENFIRSHSKYVTGHVGDLLATTYLSEEFKKELRGWTL